EVGIPGMDELERIQRVYRERMAHDSAERYSLFRPGELYMVQRREEATLRLLAGRGIVTLRGRTVLEVGCGRGQRLAEFQRWGGHAEHIPGVDLVAQFVQQCARAFPGFCLARASGHQLPYPDDTFDVVSHSTVFSSILDDGMRTRMASETIRVLKPGGLMI